jgi:hypothetical protein
MKNLGRAVTIIGVLAGNSLMLASVMVGCNGDNTMDGGPDSANDSPSPDVKNDITPPVDASDAGDSGGDGNTAVNQFRTDLAKAFCNRFQNCCNSLDGGFGAFDVNKCVTAATASAYNGSNAELNSLEVLARNNVMLDTTASASCIAGMATLSCPTVTSSEVNTATTNCYAATIGTLNAGSGCIASIECKPGNYCKFTGADGGKSEAGTQEGQCAALIGQGQQCGFAPYGDPIFTSTECEYKGWQPPTNFCDYDTFPDASGYKCAPLRANATPCFNDDECSSGICGTLGQDCVNTTCTCNTSRDFTPFCSQLGIKDAGPG